MVTRCRRFVPLCCGTVVLSLASLLAADDPQAVPANPPVAPAADAPPADLPGVDPANLPVAGQPAPLKPAAAAPLEPAPVPQPGAVVAPQPQMVPGVTYYPPTPIVEGNGWAGGWSGAYAPSGSYWYGVPAYTYAPAYVPGYTWGIYPTTWNGYWNYSTAYGAPGYTAYWHGWYAGTDYSYGYGGYPYGCGYGNGCGWDYAYPTWHTHGWGYSTIDWGHGFWHRHRIFAPLYGWGCGW